MQAQILGIDSIRSSNSEQETYIADIWQSITFPSYDCCEECPNYPDCYEEGINCGANVGCGNGDPCGHKTYFLEGPLLDTEWSQGCVYNELCPEEPILPNPVPPLPAGPLCGGLPCGHHYTGCVATAMAQVINYFEYPLVYNYSSLLPIYYSFSFGASGANEVAQLMIDAAESVDMDWKCSGSSANTADVNNALEKDFGYSHGGDFSDYTSSAPVKQNIEADKPVIFGGCREEITFIFNWRYLGCHAWVCDGYRGWENECYSYLYYNMNWGWNGAFNGWFGSWSPGGSNYQYNKRVLLNITP